MELSKKTILLLLTTIFLLIVVSCSDQEPVPGDETTYKKEVDIITFADANADGVRDPGEPGLENVLVYASYNIHGGFMRTAARTTPDGTANLVGSYTHFFDVLAVSPCGYRATTGGSVNALENRYNSHAIEFGFTADEPRAGKAILRFHFWYDQDQDGILDETEKPWQEPAQESWQLPSLIFHTSPMARDIQNISNGINDDLAIIPDSNGEAVLDLGNSCGLLWILEPDYWVTTGTTPTLAYQPDSSAYLRKDWVAFDYDLGETDIWWGAIHWKDLRSE